VPRKNVQEHMNQSHVFVPRKIEEKELMKKENLYKKVELSILSLAFDF